MNAYAVYHTVDQAWGRCAAPEGWLTLETDSLDEAIAAAEEVTAAGQCGYVLRREDGKVLAPDGTWVLA